MRESSTFNMIVDLLDDIYRQSRSTCDVATDAKTILENLIGNIYQSLYRSGQPIHTIGLGILRQNTFDMYYTGRIPSEYAEKFGSMSYEVSIAGRACELFKKNQSAFLNLYSKGRIIEEFEKAGDALKQHGWDDESTALKRRGEITVDQGIGSFLLIPLTYGNEVIGIFTISSPSESDEEHMLGIDIKEEFIPLAQFLGLIVYMEKIFYEKAEEMGRLLISSIDAKDEYQATHSLNVRTMIDMFIDEVSRDKELRTRFEEMGFKLTIEKIEKLRLAALLHDIGKIHIPSSILRKSSLNDQEILVRKAHSYYTYNILNQSNMFRDIAGIASMHHARYFIPRDPDRLDRYAKVETSLIGYPLDRICSNSFFCESQIISLADTFNAIIRDRPNGTGLSVNKAIELIEKDEYAFHGGLKDIFLTVVKRILKNIDKNVYSPEVAAEYSRCLWLERSKVDEKKHHGELSGLERFIGGIKHNTLGIIALMDYEEGESLLLKTPVEIDDRPMFLAPVQREFIVLSVKDISRDEGFIWINKIFDYLRTSSFKGKASFALIGKSGREAVLSDIYDELRNGLIEIKNEPVHYYLTPMMFKV